MKQILTKRWAPFCLYICVSFLIYGASLTYDLTFLDDNVWLKDYRWYLKDIRRVFQIFTENDVLFGGLFYRPMIYLTFILDTQWAGKGYFSYHFTNIWIHIFNSSLVFALFQKLQFKRQTAFVGGLLFCVHPVMVSAVAWIPGRTDSLLALFVFSSFYFFLNWLDDGRKRNLTAHLVALFLALLTKETAVVAAALFLLFICLFRKISLKDVFLFIAWAGMLVFYFFLRQGGVAEKYNSEIMPMLASLWGNLPAVISYLGKAVLPFNVSVLPVKEDLTLLYGILAFLGLVLVGLVTKSKNIKIFIFSSAWFLTFLLPSLIFSFLKHEYRLYVPLFGLLWIVLHMLKNQKRHVSVLLAVALLFAGISLWHSRHYRDRFAFWENAVAASPHAPLAHRNLGAMYYLDNRFKEAEKEFLKALELNPKEKMCYNNLGLIYERRKEYLRAEEAYFKEIEINPYYEVVHYNLGLFYYKLGMTDNAVQLWERTTELNPRYAPAYQHLLFHYKKQNDQDNALKIQRRLNDLGVGQ